MSRDVNTDNEVTDDTKQEQFEESPGIQKKDLVYLLVTNIVTLVIGIAIG